MRKHFAGLVAALVAAPLAAQPPLPFDLGGAYSLTDQHGETRTEQSPDGYPQLVFFGYANCLNICSAALPTMAGVVDALAADGIPVTPVMITVAPEQDSVDTIGAPLEAIHPDFVGLTGSEADLQVAYDAFSVEREPLFQDPEHGWVYAHGSFIHLLDAEGKVLTLLPPVMSISETTEIFRGYLQPG